MIVPIHFKKINPNAKFPSLSYAGDIGWNFFSTVDVCLSPGVCVKVPTGIKILMGNDTNVPTFYAQLFGRSSHALQNIHVGGGVIDRCYEGEIFVLLINNGDKSYQIRNGDAVAQLVFITSPSVQAISYLNYSHKETTAEEATEMKVNMHTQNLQEIEGIRRKCKGFGSTN